MKKKTLVFTDLDGTLLDHYTYQTVDAEETIAILTFHNIPIIPNSSKTFPEIMLIRQQLHLDTPFIIENGAAIYIPLNHFIERPQNVKFEQDFWVKSFCQEKEHWIALLAKHATSFREYYQGFSEMDVAQLAELTGLSLENAAMAKQRQYGEPVNWLGNEAQKQAFIELMQSLGANVLQGGRFLHISGHCDKGKAQHWLAQEYQLQMPTQEVKTIALGDGQNDAAMLEQASIAIQIKSPVHDFPELKRKEGIVQSSQYGPAGWAECLQETLALNLKH